MKKNMIKHNLKDSLFTSLFSIPKYLRELYLSLPESDEGVTEGEIKIELIRNILAYGIYNDLGFTVRGKSLFLIEAQSTLCPFIAQRMNNYFCSLLYQAFPHLEIEQYRSKERVDLPEVLLAVVYTGKEEVPDYYETEFSFNSGQTIKINVLVLTKHNTKGILKAYCIFAQEYDKNYALYGRTAEAVIETIEFCNDCEDTIFIREYLKEKEEEIINIMSEEERQTRLTDKIMRYERETAFAEGESRGEARGVAKGEARGKFSVLLEFIKDGLISEDSAAKKVNMTLEDFRKAAAAYSN